MQIMEDLVISSKYSLQYKILSSAYTLQILKKTLYFTSELLYVLVSWKILNVIRLVSVLKWKLHGLSVVDLESQ
jgi:hypothetical protein